MIELTANAKNARNETLMDAVAISVNSSLPQFDTQSSTLVADADEADINRYAIICKLRHQFIRPTDEKFVQE